MCIVPLSVYHPLCGSSAGRAGGQAGSFAGVSQPSPSPGAKIGLEYNYSVFYQTFTNTHPVSLGYMRSCDVVSLIYAILICKTNRRATSFFVVVNACLPCFSSAL